MAFCMHCGKELPNDAKFCNFCGQAAGEQTNCENDGRETVVIETNGSYYWNKNLENGMVTLTNRRFLFEGKHDPSLLKVFMLGPILSQVGKEEYRVEFAGGDIIDVREGKRGIVKTIVIVTRDEEEHHFVLSGMQKNSWLIALRNLMEDASD